MANILLMMVATTLAVSPLIAGINGEISTHVLDTCKGAPVSGMSVTLCSQAGGTGEWTPIFTGTTNNDGRISDMLNGVPLVVGTYRLNFDMTSYCTNRECFFQGPQLTFRVDNITQKYHVPLLLSPYSYSTYRGS